MVRITLPLPLGIDHVHAYAIRGASGGQILVDTGLGVDGAEAFWRHVHRQIGAVDAIVVSHWHPDHMGGVEIVRDIFGCPVYQGRSDYEVACAGWDAEAPARLATHIRSHGMPNPLVEEAQREDERLSTRVHWRAERRLLDAGDILDGWQIVVLPGHASGHIGLLRDGVLVGGDVVLDPITPHISLAPPEASPDPLADYLSTMQTLSRLNVDLVLPGHHQLIDDPSARIRQLLAHHDHRLNLVAASVRRPVTAYEASLSIFSDQLSPVLRRFALLETLAHLEHLCLAGRLRRLDHRYAPAQR